jgi:hypothetical protein
MQTQLIARDNAGNRNRDLFPQWNEDTANVAQENVLLPGNDDAAGELLKERGASIAYGALRSLAEVDLSRALRLTAQLLVCSEPALRYAGVALLGHIDLPETRDMARPLLYDPDLRVALAAFEALEPSEETSRPEDFERIERLLWRMPEKPETLTPLVWSWAFISTDRSRLADALTHCLGKLSAIRLTPYLATMSATGRTAAVEAMRQGAVTDASLRLALVKLVGDSSPQVREKAVSAVKRRRLLDDEAPHLERLLGRKASDLRRSVISLLLTQPDGAALNSARRLLESHDPQPRLAGLEMLSDMVKRDRAAGPCRTVAAAYHVRRGPVAGKEAWLVESLLPPASAQTGA